MGEAKFFWTQDEIDRANRLMRWMNEKADTVVVERFEQGIPETPSSAIHITFLGWLIDYNEFRVHGSDKL